ncbi:MAG: DUF262 domain-containing protein [Candidatus Sumerlaeota bacterium]|nr:DUF262 domain-containing protein [Candidatus Sumerlaeota bacterium]
MQMRSDSREIDKIYKRRDRYEIPDWQREKVWPKEKKQLLIDTILRDWRLPKFYFLKVSSDPDEFEVVDGQQRLEAIFEFLDNELPLSDQSAKEFKAAYYKKLPEALSDRFDDYKIEYDEITEATEKELKEFFQRLQDGLPLTSSEKLNSVHSNLRDFAKRLAKHDFFKNKIATNSKRLAYFDIAAKVTALEIEGIDAGLRYDDLKATFEAQANFSARSNVAQRLRTAFDYLDQVFPAKSDILRNRAIVQSFATLVCRLIISGKQNGHEDDMRHFFESFIEKLSQQVTLGREATDADYLLFQKTVTSNVRRNAQIRHEILLRKLLVFQPAFADLLGVSMIAESGIEQSLDKAGKQIAALIQKKNEEYSRDYGEDLFKATNKTSAALTALGEPLHNYNHYRDWLDGLYFLFRESVGQRLDSAWPQSFADVNALRTAEHHDVDHGKEKKVAAKRLGLGKVFKKYAGATTPSTLAPESFVVVQAKLLAALESDLRTLKWK